METKNLVMTGLLFAIMTILCSPHVFGILTYNIIGESDPIANPRIDALNLTKLNIVDQRYNDTALINNLISAINSSKLDITDQRYNETGLIISINNSLSNYNDTNLINNLISALNNSKLDITDQRYNETLLISSVNNSLSNYNETNLIIAVNNSLSNYNETDLINALNLSKLDITDQRYNETGLIISINNSLSNYNDTSLINNLISALNNSKLDITDQRYNETGLILNVNGSLYSELTNYFKYGQNINLSGYNFTADNFNGYINWSYITNTPSYVLQNSQVRTTGPLFVNGGTNANIDSGFNLSIAQANNVTGGFLTATDWNLFNNKLNATDQRYNETDLILQLNNTLPNYNYSLLINDLNLSKLDKTDQRYNDTEEITAALTTYYYNVTSATITRGTGSGNFSSINVYDSVSYNITEQSGAVGLNVTMNVSGLTDINQLIFRYKTSASENHVTTLYLYDYEDGTWESYDEVGAVLNWRIFVIPVFDSDEHIQNGTLLMKIESLANGNTGHIHQFDWVQVSKGIATPSSVETDPFSLHLTGGEVTGDTTFNNVTIDKLIVSGFINDINITQLNTTLSLQIGRIDTLNSTLITQTDRIDTLNSTLITQTGRIDTLNSTLITQTDRIDTLNSTKADINNPTFTGNVTATNLNITNILNINGENGSVTFNGGLSGGISYNSSDLCLISGQNSTGYRNIFCITKPTG